MKCLISILLILSMLLSLSACGAKREAQDLEDELLDPSGDAIEIGVDELSSPASPENTDPGAAADADCSGLNAFIASTLSPMFSNLDGKNRVYSPLNVYIALAMLAEITDGDTRAQIMELLGKDSVEALRTEVKALWEASHRDGGEGSVLPGATILPAASLWLRDDDDYHADTLQTLADDYCASAFSGMMGSREYTQQLRDWVNECTNHLLEAQANGLELDAGTLIALVTTLYFKANWAEAFSASATENDVFHAVLADENVPFMHKSETLLYYSGERFAAVYLPMSSGTGMWILLPDEGVSVEELASDAEALRFLSSNEKSADCTQPIVELSLPKFDVDSDLDLCAMLAKLGVTNVFDASASDFSPLTDRTGLAVTDIEHAARVKIDEEGCEAAAFTMISVKGAAFIPEPKIIEFVCDRPFFFAVTGPADQMLFAGAVNTIAGV